MGYEPLPIREVGVDKLRLDLDNYRIPTHRDDETAALKYLFLSEDVLGAARMIVRDGYFDNEVPVVVADDDGLYVVLEGNRRVSALKALLNPEGPRARGRDAGTAEAVRRRGRAAAQSNPSDGG